MAGDREAAVGRWWSGAKRLVDEEAAMVGAQDLAMRENGGGRDKKKPKKGLNGFQTRLYLSVNRWV
jgi:hypothetical protein